MTGPRHPGSKLLERMRTAIRVRGMSRRTEEVYARWVRRFVRYHGLRHPETMGEAEIAEFLSHLAVDGNLSPSTQNQAASALVFLYRNVLGIEMPWIDDVVRARRPKREPLVLSVEEVQKLLREMTGDSRLVASILYGSGLRLLEALNLRVKDVDLTRGEMMVRSGKGAKDRRAILPKSLREPIATQLERVVGLHQKDLKAGRGWVALPGALDRKFPNAGRELPWQWLFPASRHYRDPGTGQVRRHHLHESVVQRHVRAAVQAAGIPRRATCHTFRHSFATHLLASGHEIRTVQTLLGHQDIRTTMIYLHVLDRNGIGVRSPLDFLDLP